MKDNASTFSLAAALSTLLTSYVTFAQELVNHPGEVDSAVLYNVQLQQCPVSCDSAGPNPLTWTSYRGYEDLLACDETILFTFNVQNTASKPLIKACTTSSGGPIIQAGAYYGLLENNDTSLTNVSSSEAAAIIMDAVSTEDDTRQLDQDKCGASLSKSKLDIEQFSTGSGSGDVASVASALENYLRDSADCGRTLMFSRAAGAIMAAFAGSSLTRSTAADLVKSTLPGSTTGQDVARTCNTSSDSASLDTRFLVAADTTGDFAKVQDLVRGYINDGCADLAVNGETTAAEVTVLDSSIFSTQAVNTSSRADEAVKLLKPRAYCRDTQVQSGDSCGALASRCGISGYDFERYNSKTPNLCSTLKVKQWVCCSEGELQDHTPQPDSSGMCATYTIKPDDGCWAISDSYGISQQRIIDSNKKTWGFAGCDRLQVGQVICLSSGEPPMPAQDPTAVCGPQVVGSTRPSNWDDIAKLNQCKLNACCDVWGQCGTTDEFCVDTTIDGHPGTAEPNTNGCISNCGTDIVNNGAGPANFARVGYFEGFNKQRPCLTMDITQFDTSTYTHIHFAFAIITSSYTVGFDDDKTKEQFDKMVKMDTKGAKKILSFGGWSFSTEADTAPIFAQSVSGANRELFANNVVKFMNDNNLDGLDFDWEYPGAYDIPNSVPGSPEDGANYLAFLQSVRRKMPSGKSLSIALPGSFWYLRGFPVKEMNNEVDYFIFMTYDLHGQWDYGSKWANPGCDNGNCLRSHINKTETENSLSMLTKAGVQSNKVMVGVSSYGRSFKMADPSCTDVHCKFTGSFTVSEAEPGECTGTGGYISDAELRELRDYGGDVRTWFDDASDSDIMTWNGNWVAWMDTQTKDRRIDWVRGLNFAGTTDWAVDLQEFRGPAEGEDGYGEIIDADPLTCEADYADLNALVADIDNVPVECVSLYLIAVTDTLLDKVLQDYDVAKNDYDGKFGYYAQYINDLVNPQLFNWMNNWHVDEEKKTGLGNQYFDCQYKRPGENRYRYEGACPVPHSIMADGTWDDPEIGYESWEIRYTLRDEDGFNKALGKDLGISPDWIKWEDWDSYPECEGSPGDCVEVHQWLRNFPRKKDQIDVVDPKEVMEEALPNIEALRGQFKAAVLAVGLNLYDPDNDMQDSALSLITPVQMLAQAVQSVNDVKDIGGKIEEQKKKETILLIVSLILMVVPFLGEVGFSLAGLSSLARLAFVAGEVANGALSLAEIIDDPESAPLAIMGMLVGAAGRGRRTEEVMSEAVQARRLIDAGSMGRTYKEIDDKVAILVRKCAA